MVKSRAGSKGSREEGRSQVEGRRKKDAGSMIGSLMYLTASRPDIMFAVCACARSAEVTTAENGEVTITAIIDGHSLTITEGSLRRHLKLDDQDGLSSIPNSEIFEQLALLGIHHKSDSDKFIQLCLDMQRNQLQQHTRSYPVPSLSMKVFNNMKRPTKGFSGQEVALFPTMLDVTEPSTSPSRITSSPSHSPEPSTQHSPDNTTAAASQPSPTQPSPTHLPPGAEHHFSPPHDSPLHAVHSHGSDEGSLKLNELMNLVTKLSDRIGVLEDDLKKTKKTYSSAYTLLNNSQVKKLESQIKTGKARRKARVVLSDDEVIEDDSSKQGRKLSDAEVQEKASTETELFIQEVTPTEVIQDQEGMERSDELVLIPRCAEERRSAEKGQDKEQGEKAIMIESEPTEKKRGFSPPPPLKKELEQERLSFAEAIRLEEQMNKEQRAQIARDEEIARQWDEEERQRAMAEAKSTKKIDWNDPFIIMYHTKMSKDSCPSKEKHDQILEELGELQN
ncbi:hypothetical protein Tco_1105322 [Tanacetum coccineum]